MTSHCPLSKDLNCFLFISLQIEKQPVNPHEEQEIIDGIEDTYYNNESFDTSLFELQVLDCWILYGDAVDFTTKLHVI